MLLGMPNVGKSSIVTAVSTAAPEINDYPFTTRQLKMGHVERSAGDRFQAGSLRDFPAAAVVRRLVCSPIYMMEHVLLGDGYAGRARAARRRA